MFNNDDGLVQQAVQISRVLRDQLLIDGEKAFKGQFENNLSWRNTIEACGLTAGLVGVLVESVEQLQHAIIKLLK